MTFNPSDIGVKNGNYFGLPYSVEESEVLILSCPWDVTTSYRPGTRNGPEAMLEASLQVDLTSTYIENAWEKRIGTLPMNTNWLKLSESLRVTAAKIISGLETGLQEKDFKNELKLINEEGARFHQSVYEACLQQLKLGKKLVLLGGDHATSYGAIKAAGEFYKQISILHFDAHADLRVAYEGFEHSHASIMNHVKDFTTVEKLVQVGIRDFSKDEFETIQNHPKIKCFFDNDLKQMSYKGITWDEQCNQIVSQLGDQVYVSFDIDGLDPRYCPHTGTPVPGGQEFDQVVYLMNKVRLSGRKIVGADLVEVAPNEADDQDEWDANVGARLLFQICLLMSD